MVVTTQLPEELTTNAGLRLEAARRCARQVVARLAPGQYVVSEMQFRGYPCIELQVPGRIPSMLYPQSSAVLARGRWRGEYFGMSRYVITPDQIVEAGIVVAKPLGIDTAHFPSVAASALDRLMEGLAIEVQPVAESH